MSAHRVGARVARLVAGAAGLSALLLVAPAGAQKRKLSIEDVTAEPPLAGRPVTDVTWLAGGARFSWIAKKDAEEDGASELWVEETATGRRTRVLSTTELRLPEEGVTPAVQTSVSREISDSEKPPRSRRISLIGSAWAPDGSAVVVMGGGDLWLVRASGSGVGRLERLTRAPGKEEFPTFSPDGRRIAFVRDNDLYAIAIEGRTETRLTRDGSETIYNGKLDWVYEEELAGREGRGYEWSPDSSSIAYLRLDDGPVGRYPLVDFLAVPPSVEWQRYPKAGTANPTASFHVVGVDGAERAAVRPEGESYVVPGFSWTADSRSVSYRVMNRAQDRQEVRLLTPADRSSKTLFVEEDRFWLNVVDPPRFLRDGRYVWESERSGWAHFYVGDVAGGEPKPITRGDWMVDRLVGVDERGGFVYFTATEEDVRRRPIYRVGLDGARFSKVTSFRGTHVATLSPDASHLLSTASSVTQPPVLSLLDSSGRTVRVVDRPASRVSEFELGHTEEVEVHADDGVRLEARLVKPADFDPGRKYPVIVYVYGGPHAQVVRDNWGATSLLDHYLAGRGFLVWSVDNRGSFGRGHEWESAIFRDMGRRELADQLAGVRYVRSLPFVDPERVGIWGWSYGGYMTLYAMTNSPETWRCGVAGAPVTHYKFYDTIYTERYMRTPQENPEGYERSAPLTRAKELRAPLLLIHGAADDNVHLQNTIAFVDALAAAGRPYELQIQPRQKHGFRSQASQEFRNRAIVRFFEENLR